MHGDDPADRDGLHPRTIFALAFLAVWWTVCPIALTQFIRARKQPSIISRSYYCTCVSAVYSICWVTVCLLQDILLTEGYGFPCVVGLLMSLAHLVFFSTMSVFKAYQITFIFRPEIRTPRNMRVFDRRWMWAVVACVMAGVVGAAVAIIFSFPERYIDPLRNHVSLEHDGVHMPIGGRECCLFQNWYIYLGANLIFIYIVRDVGRAMAHVDDFWGVGNEVRRATRLIVLFNLPFHLLNALAWFDVFDRPSFESRVCPIAYFWVMYHIANLANNVVDPLLNKAVSLEDVVRQQRQAATLRRQRTKRDLLAKDVVEGDAPSTWIDSDGVPSPRANRVGSVDSMRPTIDLHMAMPTIRTIELGSVHTTKVGSTTGSPSLGAGHLGMLSERGSSDGKRNHKGHLLRLLEDPACFGLFEHHARRALCAETTLFWRHMSQHLRAVPKWAAWMQAIGSRQAPPSGPASVVELPPLALPSPAGTPVFSPTHASSLSPPMSPAIMPTLASPPATAYFSSDAEAHHLLHLFDRCYEQYVKRGAMYELNLPSALYKQLHALNRELRQAEYYPLVREAIEMPPPTAHNTPIATASRLAAATPSIMPLPAPAEPALDAFIPIKSAAVVPLAVEPGGPSLHIDVGNAPNVPALSMTPSGASRTAGLAATASVPSYPVGPCGDLALRSLRVFVQLECEMLALMCTNLYGSFVASAEYRALSNGAASP